MDHHAADYARYHAGPDIDDSELMPLPEEPAERAKLLVQCQKERGAYDSIEEWCADSGYDTTVLEWLRTQPGF